MDDWDLLAATFDVEADHGLRDPQVRAAWKALLLAVLPGPPLPDGRFDAVVARHILFLLPSPATSSPDG